MIRPHHVRVDVMGVARNILDIRLFDSLFVADSGGEEQGDGLLG